MSGTRKTILLVEDEALIALSEAMMLKKEGYEVITASNGLQAIDIMQSGAQVDLILMDIDLGKGIDGTETAEIILKHHDVPVVFLSSHIEKKILDKTRKITRYGYILKHLGEAFILASIEMAFELHQSHRELKENERRFKDLLTNVQLISVMVDTKGNVTFCNDYFFELTGWTPEQVLGHNWFDVLIPENAKIRDIFKENIGTKQFPLYLENEILTASGKLLYIGWNNTVLFDLQGNVLGVASIGEDITVHRQAMEDLRNAYLQVSQILESITDGFFTLNENLDMTYFNHAAEKILDRKREDIIGKNFLDVFPEARGSIFEINYRKAIQEKKYIAFESYFDPEPYRNWYDVRVYPRQNGISIYFQVSTERKRMEQDILEKSQELEQFFKFNLDLLAITDIEGNARRLNPEWENTLGVKLEELINNNCFNFIHPDDIERTREAFRQAMEGKNVVDFVNRYRHKNGSYRVLEWRTATLKGKLLFCAARDITEQQKNEQKIRSILEEKELLLREVHHRVKNHMNILYSLLGLSSNSITDSNALEAIKECRTRIGSMQKIYDKLYISSNLKKIEFKPYLMELISFLSETYNLSRGNIEIKPEIEEGLLNIQTALSCGLLINELMSNSFKYAFEGRVKGLISIRIERVKEENPGSQQVNPDSAVIRLTFSDNGVGLPEGVNPRNPEGFGLQLVQVLVGQLEGTMRINREEGTEFVIEFVSQFEPVKEDY